MSNYDIRMFRNSLSSYINQSPIEPEIKFLVLKDLAAQAEKEADTAVVREASELEKAAELKADAKKRMKGKELQDNGSQL